ncbi:SPOR domain-containing protein [Psychrobacter fulvigenes]|uniref:SPOR domain-containing protein n=1 Tax=Psychrobacter fulvigenes TaxID=533323 RepID=UPI00191A9727|nr:SPOR domain-containing protein [Psychrobacter fulvigenes]
MLAKKPKGATEKRKSSSVSGLLWMFVGAVLTLMIGVFLYLSPLFDFSPAGSDTAADADRQVQPRVETDTDNSDYEFYEILPNQEMATIPDEDIGETGNDRIGDISAFEPDVVVTQPEDTLGSRNEDTDNLGVSENTTIEPSRGNNAASDGGDEIVIVEENATYDGTPTTSNSNTANNAGAGTASVQQAAPATTYILQINSFGNADEADRRRAQVLMAGVDAKVLKNTTANGLPIYQVISRSMSNRQAVTSAQQRLQNNGIDSIIVEQRR